MTTHGRHILSWFLVLLLASCGAGESPPGLSGPSFVVRDSAGVEIVISAGPKWKEDLRFPVEPTLVLGPEVDHDHFLHSVGNIERLFDGRLVVENRGTRELLVFDSSGVFLETWGGRGEGPGEFGRMLGLFRCSGGRVVEVEPRHLKLRDNLGRPIGTMTAPSEVVGPNHVVWGMDRGCRSAFVASTEETLYRPTGLGSHSYKVRALWVSLITSAIDTVGTFRGRESLSGSRGRPRASIPFAYNANWATDGERVVYGWGDRPEILLLSSEGTVERIVRWRTPPEPITEEDWDAYESDRRRRVAAEPRYASVYATREEHPHPDTKPYFGPVDAFGSAFLVSDTGELWVRRFRRFLLSEGEPHIPPTMWLVFGADGRWLGSVEAPAGFDVRNVRGGLVLGVWRDRFGTESVRGYRTTEREP